MGSYKDLIEEAQGFNSGLIGLRPGYDFGGEIVKNCITKPNKNEEKAVFNYAEEQGLLMYTLLKTQPLIGCSKEFIGVHPDCIYFNCINNEVIKELKLDENKVVIDHTTKTEINPVVLKKIFEKSSAVHFLQANRHKKHYAWTWFARNKIFL